MITEAQQVSPDIAGSPRPSDEAGRPTQGDGHDTSVEFAEAIMNRAATQTLDTMRDNLRTMTDFTRPAIEMVHDQSRRAADAAAQLTGACHKAAESTIGDVEALALAGAQFSCGAQEWQHACADLMRRSTERMIRNQRALLSCRSADEFARAQQDIYRDAIESTIQASLDLLKISARITQDMVKPLESRTLQHAQGG